tara:strand:- start:3 stop:203 length:201 start_codon:yes stop_codon:yes gene_type:complete
LVQEVDKCTVGSLFEISAEGRFAQIANIGDLTYRDMVLVMLIDKSINFPNSRLLFTAIGVDIWFFV